MLCDARTPKEVDGGGKLARGRDYVSVTPDRIASLAIHPLAQQGQRIFFNQFQRCIEQSFQWDSLNKGFANIHPARIGLNKFFDRLKARRIPGEVWTFYDA